MTNSDNKVKPELLPCPFCGGEPIYRIDHVDYVQCSVCLTTGPNASIVGGMNRFDEAWNNRADSPKEKL